MAREPSKIALRGHAAAAGKPPGRRDDGAARRRDARFGSVPLLAGQRIRPAGSRLRDSGDCCGRLEARRSHRRRAGRMGRGESTHDSQLRRESRPGDAAIDLDLRVCTATPVFAFGVLVAVLCVYAPGQVRRQTRCGPSVPLRRRSGSKSPATSTVAYPRRALRCARPQCWTTQQNLPPEPAFGLRRPDGTQTVPLGVAD